MTYIGAISNKLRLKDLSCRRTLISHCERSALFFFQIHFAFCVPVQYQIDTINTMKLAVIATLLANVAAFAPNQKQHAVSTTALSASAWDGKVGVQAPLGYFDPLKMLADADEAQFEQLRYQELKHGRIAQLAFLGNIVVLSGMRFPGYLSNSENIKFSDLPNHGIEAISKVPAAGLAQIALFITCVEIGSSQLKGEFKGDYTSVIDFGWAKQTDAWKKKKMAIELNNGRAAQMGILGLITHELIGNLDSMPIIGLQN